jgi:hypothetical protein
MIPFNSYFRNLFIFDVLFIAADLWVSSGYRSFYESRNVDVLLILECLFFLLYAWMIRICHQWPQFIRAHQELENKIPSTLFWLKLGHIFSFIYIPFGLFIFFLTDTGVYNGDGELVIIVFLLMPFTPILIGWAIGTDMKCSEANPEKLNIFYWIFLNAGFIIVFAFIDITFKNLGDWLCLELTKEITGVYRGDIEPLMILEIIYRVLFIWLVFIPVRMWLLIPFYKDKLKMIGFVLSIIFLLCNDIIF